MTGTLQLPVVNIPPPSYVPANDTSGPEYADVFRAFLAWLQRRMPVVDATSTGTVYADAWAEAMADSTSVTSPLEDARAEIVVATTRPPELLDLISKTLSLTKSELARSLRVSRQTIYDWLRGKDLSPENDRRLRRLSRLAWEFGGSANQSILRRFVVEPPRQGMRSVLDLLEDEVWDEAQIKSALGEAQGVTERRETTRADAWLRSLGFPVPSQNAQTANLDYNLSVDDTKQP